MKIVAELSVYPLGEGHIPTIIRFIHDLRDQSGIEVVTNQMSTQVRGEFEAVTAAINGCMRRVMEKGQTVVLLVKYLNADLDIASQPRLG